MLPKFVEPAPPAMYLMAVGYKETPMVKMTVPVTKGEKPFDLWSKTYRKYGDNAAYQLGAKERRKNKLKSDRLKKAGKMQTKRRSDRKPGTNKAEIAAIRYQYRKGLEPLG